MIRVLRVGGKALIYVWAKNQIQENEKSSYLKQDRKNRHQQTTAESSTFVQEEVYISDNGEKVPLPIHTNRTQFKAKDMLVPWKTKNGEEKTFLRFYHVYEENELEDVCCRQPEIVIRKSFYDQGNWCVIFEKISK